MSVKRGLLGFGMSAALITGGGFSLKEWHDANSQRAEVMSCQNTQNNLSKCAGILATNETLSALNVDRNVYGSIAFLALVGGAIVTGISVYETMQDEDEPSVV